MAIRPFAQTCLLALTVAVAPGCGGSGEPAAASNGSSVLADAASEQAAVTFHRDVRPLIEAHCSSCHREGGIAPFALGYSASEWESGAPLWAAQAVSAVESRAMPPWMPDPECRDYEHSRRLSDDQLAVFTGWRDASFAQGDPDDYAKLPISTGEDLGEPDLTLMPDESYTPSTARVDDYRCFLLPAAFEAESYLVATDVRPGAIRHVHHVILYAVDADSVQDVKALDAEDAGPGYTCYGGPAVSRSQNVGGWVPGMVPNVAPENSARVLPKGTRLIMQIHYNTGNVAAEEKADADRTSARLWLMPKGKVPSYRITTMPLANTGIKIAAGDADSVQTKVFNVPTAGTIVGVLPHMHTLGKRIEVVREKDDACLVRVPDWNFHWQQGYRFTKEAFLEVARGDRLTLTCVYDNSGHRAHAGAHDDDAGSAPTEPVDVAWGEGTADEMCLNYVELRTPFARSLADECPTYDTCVDGCAASDAACLAGCTGASAGCRQCTTPALARCAQGRCESEGLALQGCTGMCGNQCAGMCRAEAEAFFSCIEPSLRDGSCDALFESCGA